MSSVEYQQLWPSLFVIMLETCLPEPIGRIKPRVKVSGMGVIFRQSAEVAYAMPHRMCLPLFLRGWLLIIGNLGLLLVFTGNLGLILPKKSVTSVGVDNV